MKPLKTCFLFGFSSPPCNTCMFGMTGGFLHFFFAPHSSRSTRNSSSKTPRSEEWKLGNQICLGGEGGKKGFLSSSKIHWWDALASLSRVLVHTLSPLSGDISAPGVPGHRLWPHSAHAFFSLYFSSFLSFLFLSSSSSGTLGLLPPLLSCWGCGTPTSSTIQFWETQPKIFVDTCLS